jgi:hypothetical protein
VSQAGHQRPHLRHVQWDQFTADQHRDWLCLDAEGKEYGTSPFAPGFYRNLDVFHPGYRQFLFDHVAEICETMPAVDGFFFDIVQPFSSCALHWKQAMAKAGLDPGRRGRARPLRGSGHPGLGARNDRLRARARAAGHDLLQQRARGAASPAGRGRLHALGARSLPSGGWGYMHFPQAMRYARTLQRECLGMTGKFHTSWGDFGSYKNPAALQFECFQMVALGAVCSVGDQLPPRGKLDRTPTN